jgi:antitoxin component of RelBE/YafQ-DinJ toxin-antitoxin module
MSKLTLSVDPAIVARAKRYAKQQGVSISEMVELYLTAVSRPSQPPADSTPVLRALRGSLKRARLDDYHRYLEKKYR